MQNDSDTNPKASVDSEKNKMYHFEKIKIDFRAGK